MTFIASVVAKRGVAVIADSLVTTKKTLIDLNEFLEYVKKKNDSEKPENQEDQNNLDDKINIDFNEVLTLFKDKASHTKDYEEKLFKYDNYTAIATAGSASINDKRIGEIISELVEHNHSKKNKRSYSAKNLETKVKDFCDHIAAEAKISIEKNGRIGNTTFIFTNYNKSQHKSTIYKIEVNQARKEDLKNPDFQPVSYRKQDEEHRIVCDGQNRISEKILYGDRDAIINFVPKIIDKITKDFNIPEDKIPDNYFSQVILSKDIMNESFFDDMKIFQLSNLSLQQAVDLACLLMRMEIDFQKYTKNIPTVGGIIKLATISEKGFEWLSGNDITKPDYI